MLMITGQVNNKILKIKKIKQLGTHISYQKTHACRSYHFEHTWIILFMCMCRCPFMYVLSIHISVDVCT